MTDGVQATEGTPGTVSVEEAEALAKAEAAEEALRQQAIAKSASSGSQPETVDEIKLYDPENDSLLFGPGRANVEGEEMSVIAFGPRGNFEPHVWVGPRDHPLLDSLLKAYPGMIEVTPQMKVWVCPFCEREFKSSLAVKGHLKSHKNE